MRLTALFTDGKGTLELVLVKGIKFILDKYSTGKSMWFSEKPQALMVAALVHPEIDLVSQLPLQPKRWVYSPFTILPRK